MDKTRIIVVEDNIVYCEFVCNLLAREGFRTVQAYHLSTAKKLLQQASDGDIVVSDLRLPDGDGIDLLRWMRKEGMTQPLIIMTNYAEVHTAVESMKLGSLDYIPKQLVEDKLMPLLHTILKERSALFVLSQALTRLLAGVPDRSLGGCQNYRALGIILLPPGTAQRFLLN